jgi:dipeptidyl aminopeptidase/acylaminoacyl peptidase
MLCNEGDFVCIGRVTRGTAGRPIVPDDLRRQVALGSVAISPDGQQVAFTVRSVVEGRDKVGLWLVPFGGGEPRCVRSRSSFDFFPRFSGNSDRLAFLSLRNNRTIVSIYHLDSGIVQDLSGPFEEVSDLSWHPDGNHLVVAAADQTCSDIVEGPPGMSPTAYVVRRRGWRRDGADCSLMPVHLHVLSLTGSPPRRLTVGTWSASQPRVSPDGREVAFIADFGRERDIHPYEMLYRVPFAGGEVKRAWKAPGPVVDFAWEPGGGCLCRVAMRIAIVAPMGPLCLYRITADGETIKMGSELEDSIGVADWSDFVDWCVPESVLGPIQPVGRQGRLVPYRLDTVPSEPLLPVEDQPVVYSVDSSADHVVALVATHGEAPILGAIEKGAVRPLFDGRDWLKNVTWPSVDEVLLKGPVGPIRCFVLSPAEAGEGPLATVVSIHGGPTGQWSTTPPLEAVMLTGAGFRVVLPNIRGSIGEGLAWAATDPDIVAKGVEDCIAVAQELVCAGIADQQRLGALGVSFGGAVVNMLVGTTDIFAAAVSEAGSCNEVAAWGICDIDPAMRTYYLQNGDPTTPEGVKALWRTSSLRLASDIRTPLLLLQGDEDRRCPAADNEQLFSALRYLGREVEYVVYPESDHGFSLCGRPDRRIDRYKRVLEWFERYLGAQKQALGSGGVS